MTAKKTLLLQNRPYLNIEYKTLYFDDKYTKMNTSLSLTITNVGKTAALNINITTKSCITYIEEDNFYNSNVYEQLAENNVRDELSNIRQINPNEQITILIALFANNPPAQYENIDFNVKYNGLERINGRKKYDFNETHTLQNPDCNPFYQILTRENKNTGDNK